MVSRIISCRLHLTIHVLGLIYRHYRPVHYSPSSHSALAEAELVYKEDHVSHSVYVAFDMDLPSHKSSVTLRNLIAGETKVRLLVWTTTPWTLTANMVGLFINFIRLFSRSHLGYCGTPGDDICYGSLCRADRRRHLPCRTRTFGHPLHCPREG